MVGPLEAKDGAVADHGAVVADDAELDLDAHGRLSRMGFLIVRRGKPVLPGIPAGGEPTDLWPSSLPDHPGLMHALGAAHAKAPNQEAGPGWRADGEGGGKAPTFSRCSVDLGVRRRSQNSGGFAAIPFLLEEQKIVYGSSRGDAIERAELYDKLSQLNPLGRTALKPADFLEFFLS